jgi:hypothetical protein
MKAGMFISMKNHNQQLLRTGLAWYLGELVGSGVIS